MKHIAIIGAGGFVGSALCRAYDKYNFDITKVNRRNYNQCRNAKYDVVINAAMPSKRFWALNNPIDDVRETVVKTARLLYEWNCEKFVQISSISAETQLSMPYGVHKRAAEVLVENNKNSLIIRLGALYGQGLTKSALFDLVNKNHIYVDIHSEYKYIDIDYVANWIFDNIELTGIQNVGARDTISLKEVSKGIWDNPSYEGRREKLFFENISQDMPSSREVLKYMRSINKVNS